MQLCNRLKRTLHHGRRLLTAMLLMTWTGCGCVQNPAVDHTEQPVVAQEPAPTVPDVNPETVLDLNDVFWRHLVQTRAITQLGKTLWYTQDALHQSEEPLMKTVLRACFSDDEAASLKLAIALYHLHLLQRDSGSSAKSKDAHQGAVSTTTEHTEAAEPTADAEHADEVAENTAQVDASEEDATPIAENMAEADASEEDATPIAENTAEDVDYGALAARILRRLKQNDAPTAIASILPDVLDYYLGLIELSEASDADDPHTALNHALSASDAFSRAAQDRLSAFYHWSREGEVKACIAARSTCQATDAIRRFIATYPDYPALPELKLWLAMIFLEQEKWEDAQGALEDVIWDYPWSQAAARARQIVEEHNWTLRERSYAETLEHVDFLRKKRFWNLAQVNVDEALKRFPDDPQLLLQDARISYEQSYYAPAIEKFEKLYTILGGDKRDNIRPNSVVAYIYRAYGYSGNCAEALKRQEENLARLSRNDRVRARMEYALTCGALDVVWQDAQTLQEAGLMQPWDYAFYAYLAHAYDKARLYFTVAMDTQTGTYKRRTKYFLAQATYKAALELEEKAREAKRAEEERAACLEAHADDENRETLCAPPVKEEPPKAEPPKAETKTAADTASKSKKNRKHSKAKATKPALPTIPEPSISLARSLFEQLLKENSTDYYAILAHSRIAELDGSPTLESSPLYMPLAGIGTFDPQSENAPSRAISETYTFDAETRLANGDLSAWMHKQVERYASIWPRLRRIEALHRAGLYTARNRELRPIMIEAHAISKLTKRPTAKNLWYTALSVDGHLVDNRRTDTGYWGIPLEETHFHLPDKKATAEREKIAQHQQAIFDDRASLRYFIRDASILFHDYYLARRYTGAPNSLPGTPKDNDAWSINYPHAYNHAIVEASRQNGLSPYLLWTLMNIESAFNPDSVSIADAYGLLQIIPITGYKLAEALEYKDFGPYDLIRPERSIPMGAWYFGQIVKKFGGYATLSMAGYNGGPFQVARWLTAYAGKMEHDAFIELIPLNEARNYVKKGMARLLIFERIDHANPAYYYYVSNSLPSSFEEMPNF